MKDAGADNTSGIDGKAALVWFATGLLAVICLAVLGFVGLRAFDLRDLERRIRLSRHERSLGDAAVASLTAAGAVAATQLPDGTVEALFNSPARLPQMMEAADSLLSTVLVAGITATITLDGEGNERRGVLAAKGGTDGPLELDLVVRLHGDKQNPWLALVMDDVGYDLQTLRGLLDTDLDITYSVLPGSPFREKAIEMVSAAGRELMLHLPMEPRGYPEKNPGKYAMFVDHTPEQMRDTFAEALALVPGARGVNNHMGSRLTLRPEKLAPVMSAIAERGLYFIDSITTGSSVAAKVAAESGARTALRDVFLDDEIDEQVTVAQMSEAIALARRKGEAIAIGHPRPETLTALRRTLPAGSRAVEVVRASLLVR